MSAPTMAEWVLLELKHALSVTPGYENKQMNEERLVMQELNDHRKVELTIESYKAILKELRLKYETRADWEILRLHLNLAFVQMQLLKRAKRKEDQTKEDMINKYPEFASLLSPEFEVELRSLLSFWNTMMGALNLFPARNNKGLLMEIVGVLCGRVYVTGGGQTPVTDRRVLIFVREGGNPPKKGGRQKADQGSPNKTGRKRASKHKTPKVDVHAEVKDRKRKFDGSQRPDKVRRPSLSLKPPAGVPSLGLNTELLESDGLFESRVEMVGGQGLGTEIDSESDADSCEIGGYQADEFGFAYKSGVVTPSHPDELEVPPLTGSAHEVTQVMPQMPMIKRSESDPSQYAGMTLDESPRQFDFENPDYRSLFDTFRGDDQTQ
ncbi:hypothetical protein B484DRAFT_397330 [Ochromonadaceae sp. CCMP2298]|nr:hypothetical protein B484DRAFT_397330 [Ochromonadaceae sp. CCMP2298]|mmetsp:Transcript_20568/g.46014  ORF Transcript_20568/g.46014 Transcript_20568/m.46014 type:complete len:380 (+) Transcript_20568:133-1272(+)|eukprot:CAMPEP_0173202536 /NCGR_PEP_ID=MMETSP1141-20130122/19030_1 /TAXON_ID=483371 /ORGANISM="non described non described, Strain CCMP2298" /LENGTH=379 /DNA_ID=CAMNT_0014127917 /DNA_START=70 /DNA_END=1209 /DNA_ORIENTATION=+